MAELASIRQLGFSLDREEREKGVRCTTAPIYDASGDVIAAIGVPGRSEQSSAELAQSPIVKEVTDTAMAISHALGYSR